MCLPSLVEDRDGGGVGRAAVLVVGRGNAVAVGVVLVVLVLAVVNGVVGITTGTMTPVRTRFTTVFINGYVP